MNVEEILRELKEQRDKLDAAISALGGGYGTGIYMHVKRRGRPPARVSKKVPAKKRGMSAAGRKRIAEAMRKRWAAAKKSDKKRL
jgi:hypothetical protein